MTQYNILNVKLSNLQYYKLKPGIRNGTEVTLSLSSNLIGSSSDKTNFLHKLLLTNTQISKIRKAFLKFLKTQFPKIVQLERFLFPSSGIPDLPMAPIKGLFSLANSIAKE